MMQKSIITIFTMCLSITAIAQEKQEKEKRMCTKMKIQEVHIQNGAFLMPPIDATQADFLKLAPNSTLLLNDLTGFQQGKEGKDDDDMQEGMGGPKRAEMGGSTYLGVYLGLRLGDEKKEGFLQAPVLRLGWNLNRFSGPISNYSRTTYTPFDTLQSAQTGTEYILDSAKYEHYGMSYRSSQLGLDAALIFQSSDKYRWGMHAGVGLSAAFAVNAETRVVYHQDRYVVTSDGTEFGPSTFDVNESETSTTETFKNKTGYTIGAYIPIGFDFRVGKNREFWKHVHLYLETRPGVYLTSIPELKTYTNLGLTGAFGLKVTW
jgi:hypothetical protein